MLAETLEQGQRLSDIALERLLPQPSVEPTSIHQAMRHSVFAGGKRIRPILCMEAARMAANHGGELPAGIEELGAALEMIHTYSLVHDDLPALDNDDLRRGRPTCHVAFGEATAILAGDALQTLAYQVLARLQCPPDAKARVIEEIAVGTGTVDGMIGGQVVDLESEHLKPDAKVLEYIHRSKTGALITASVRLGGVAAGAEPAVLDALGAYGAAIGLAFQIADDVLDVTATTDELGKTAGRDLELHKSPYPALLGVEGAVDRAGALVEEGCRALADAGLLTPALEHLARFIVERRS